DPGTVGAALTLPEIVCELIADGIHVHPAAAQILFAARGANNIILITDARRPAGQADGECQLETNRPALVKNNGVYLADGTLAGSMLTMQRALRNMMQFTGQPLDVLWPTSSLNAARALHIADRKGSLDVGKDADLVLVDDEINVHLTVVEGNVAYR